MTTLIKSTLHLYVLFSLLFIVGCKKDNLQDNNEVKNVETKDLVTRGYAGDNKFDLLGNGYDATERFANASSGRNQVIDVDKLYNSNYLNISQDHSVDTYFSYHFGTNAEDYSKKLTSDLNANVGPNVLLFKGEITAHFSQSSAMSYKYAYGDISYLIKQKGFSFSVTEEVLKNNFLSAKFIEDINSLTYSEIVRFYGTHVLTKIVLGAKLDLNYQSQTTSNQRIEAVKSGLSFNGLFKIFGMNANLNDSSKYASSNFDQTLAYRTVGGDASKGLLGTIPLDNSTTVLNIGNWQSGVNSSNAALIQIAPSGLVPLWEFVPNQERSTGLKNFITQYLQENQVTLTIPNSVNLYQYWSDKLKDHLYSSAPTDPRKEYALENVAFKVFQEQVPGTEPVYSFWNSKGKDHAYYMDSSMQIGGGSWQRENIAFYAYRTPGKGRIPVYVFWDSSIVDHIYRILPTAWGAYKNEGVVFYVPEN